MARARAGITSDVKLSLAANVSYDTFMNWFGGKTVPRPHELKKVADTLGISYADLMGAYEGQPPEPPSLVEAVNTLVETVASLVGEMRQEREREQDAAAAMIRASEALLSAQRRGEGAASSGRSEPADARR